MRKSLVIGVIVLSVMLFILAPNVLADAIVSNSQDWSDSYSIALRASLNGDRAFFLNSDAVSSLTKIISKTEPVRVYESSSEPFIKNLHKQLSSVGYDAVLTAQSNDFNIDLDPKTGSYYVISYDNPRISLSLASLAVKTNSWVFIVTEDNVGDVLASLKSAKSVVGVGNFKRDILNQLEPYFTDRINNNDVFKDSQDLAKEFGPTSDIVLADGQFLEMEFFQTKNPVLLSGHNKILDDTYDFLVDQHIKSVVIVGNELAVVGEQIRSRSNKEINVFVKFGQSDTTNSGKVYALTMYPLPKPKLALTVQQAIYDQKTKELVATFKNLGNAGVYELTTVSVKNDGAELATAADQNVVYIGAGELLPVRFPMIIPPAAITEDTTVEFYTSFGLSPTGLDSFLTMENRYGPPFSLPLTLLELEDDGSDLTLENVAYYKGVKRVGLSIYNNGSETTYYSAKVNNLIVNGLEKNLYKEDSILPGQTKITYIPVELDSVDIQENNEFDVFITYGTDANFQLKTINAKYPFKLESGSALTGFVTGSAGKATGVGLVVVIIVIIVLFLLAKKKKENTAGRTSRTSRTSKSSKRKR